MTTQLETIIRPAKGLPLFEIDAETGKQTPLPPGKGIRIPLSAITGEGAIERVLEELKGLLHNGLYLDPVAIGAHGRDVLVFNKADPQLPSLAALATRLMFAPRRASVVQDLHVARRWHYRGENDPKPGYDVLCVRLLTAAQKEAEDAADLLDTELFDSQLSVRDRHIANLSVQLEEEFDGAYERACERVDAEKLSPCKVAASKRKKQVPEGAATFVMKVMEREHRTGEPVEIEQLVADVVPTVPPKADTEGRDRRPRYVRAAIDKLVELEILHLHDETKVSLTGLKVGDE